MSSDFLCNVVVTIIQEQAHHLLTYHLSVLIPIHQLSYHSWEGNISTRVRYVISSTENVTQAQLLAHLFRATYLPWVTDLNGYNIQSNWNSHRRSDFFWSFLYTVEALQTDTLVRVQLYLWQPSQNFAFLNSHTNSVLLHSLRQPAPVLLRTPFLYPEGVHLWQLPLYVIHFISWTMKFRSQTLWQPENKIPWLFTDVVTITETHFVFPWFSPWLWQPWCKWEVDDTDLKVWSAHTWHLLLRNMTWPLLK